MTTESTRDGGSAGDDSLASALSAAYDEVEQAAAADAGDAGDTAAETKPGRARDEHGRFARAEGEAEAADTAAADDPAKPAGGADAAEAKPEDAEATAATDKTGVEPPANWSAADKERLAQLAKQSPEHAQWLLDRHKAMEADYTKKTTAIAEFKKTYEPVEQMLQPWQERIRAAGLTTTGLIQSWATVERALAEGKGIQVLQNLVSNYKLDRNEVAKALGLTPGAAAGAGDAKPADGAAAASTAPAVPEIPPALEPWVKELADLRDWRQQKEAESQRQAQQQQQQEFARISTEVEAFRGATDKDGKTPLHPHFDEVEKDMVHLAQVARARGEKPTLAQLYETAVWANPSTRAKALAAAQAAQQAKAKEEARAHAANARRAGSSVTGSPGAGQTPRPKGEKGGSLRDQLEEAFNESQE